MTNIQRRKSILLTAQQWPTCFTVYVRGGIYKLDPFTFTFSNLADAFISKATYNEDNRSNQKKKKRKSKQHASAMTSLG